MKTIFWILTVITLVLSYSLWFTIPEKVIVQAKSDIIKPPLQPPVKEMPKSERIAKGKRPTQTEEEIFKQKSTEPVPPPVKEQLPVKPPASKVIGDWLAELSKGTPLVTAGIAIWVKLEDNKKRKKKR